MALAAELDGLAFPSPKDSAILEENLLEDFKKILNGEAVYVQKNNNS